MMEDEANGRACCGTKGTARTLVESRVRVQDWAQEWAW